MRFYAQALIFAVCAHGDQKRKYSGEPYVVHPIRVAEIVKDAEIYIHRSECIAAALLHDVLEDTPATFDQLVTCFGDTTAQLVREISDVSKPSDGNRTKRKALDLAHLALASREAQTIKTADIIDNVLSVRKHDPQFAAVYLPEKRAQLDVLTLADEKLREQAYQIVNGHE